MTPVERLQAAIEKLEALTKVGRKGPWRWEGDMVNAEATLEGIDGSVLDASGEHTRGYIYIEPADAELIVTLHRTLDAQLAILRDGLAQARLVERFPLYWYEVPERAIALADAILGGVS